MRLAPDRYVGAIEPNRQTPYPLARPNIALMLGLKQIAQDIAAACPVGFKAVKEDARIVGFDMRRSELPADCVWRAVSFRQSVPYDFLRGVIITDSKGHQLIEVGFVIAVKLEQARTDGS